jgi:hypothetical protein
MDNDISPEEFKEEFERIPKLEASIKDALEQYKEIYIAGDKLVFTFNDQKKVEKGIQLLKDSAATFTTNITLKDYGEVSHLEIHIPENEAIFVRLSGEKIHSLAMMGFKSLPSEPKKISIDFSIIDHATVSIQDEIYLAYEKIDA